MVDDAQVKKAMKFLRKGVSVPRAARKVKLDPRTLRKYLRLGKAPSECEPAPRHWRTRPDPFDPEDMKTIYARLTDAPELEANALFEHLCEQHPDRYDRRQLRTFQRRVERWRVEHGPGQEVWFKQIHRPGEATQTDFMWITELGVTIAGEPGPPMLCHSVLPFSNVEHATLCHSESMLALRAGVQRAWFAWGSTTVWHQMDHSTAATHHVGDNSRYNEDYLGLMAHYGVTPRSIAVGKCEQNGDVESANGALRRALRQHLLLRGSSDFADVDAWQDFIDRAIEKRNRRRQTAFEDDLAAMKAIEVGPAPTWTEVDVRVSHGSLASIRKNTYSVPSNLIGKKIRARVHEAKIEVWFGGVLVLTVPRLTGSRHSLVDYRHIIHSLVRKPAAFARYHFREAMFPSPVFRETFDLLQSTRGASVKTDLEYLRILHLAATTMEVDVESALKLLIGEGRVPTADEVRALVAPIKPVCPPLDIGRPDLSTYDRLLRSAA